MKKIITLLAVVGMFIFQGCTTTTDTNYVDNDTISTVFENKNAYDFTFDNDYKFKFIFPYSIISTDMVLVYRLTGNVNGNDLWEFLPETHYFSNGTRDFSYNFDFTKYDVQIYLEGNDLASVPNENRLNQYFRIVVIPANLVYGVDKNNYPEVMAALNIKDNQIQKINF